GNRDIASRSLGACCPQRQCLGMLSSKTILPLRCAEVVCESWTRAVTSPVAANFRGGFNAKSDRCRNNSTRTHCCTFARLCTEPCCKACITEGNGSRHKCFDGCAGRRSQGRLAAHT